MIFTCTDVFSEARNVCKGEEKLLKECHKCTSFELVGFFPSQHAVSIGGPPSACQGNAMLEGR